ncbi:hypothetical protein [Altericista sp. CCNU0014]|uniref:hypothetical protein n=1 Tax=Altericista sp. CCNU0014 TaxID=3082949 RepID=UPI00384BD283
MRKRKRLGLCLFGRIMSSRAIAVEMNLAIAQHMNLSLKTVQNCVQHLKVKLDIDYLDENHTSPRVALCMEAMRRKLLTL